MLAAIPSLPVYCPNCSAQVHGPYCAQCGQETVIGVPTLREMGHEYIQTFVTVEGRLWRTLFLLLLRPGTLTNEFLRGRRRRYVRPLPLYLSLSFLFFLVFSFSAPDLIRLDNADTKAIPGETSGTARRPGASNKQNVEEDELAVLGDVPSWLLPVLDTYRESIRRFKADPRTASRKLGQAFLAKMPVAVFFMVPFFALGTAILYAGRRRAYAEHLLFALHFHAFVFLLLLVLRVLLSDGQGLWFFWIWWAYLAWASRSVFGGGWTLLTLKSLVLLLLYGTLLAAVMVIVAAIALPSV
jgi:hypothetical protein